LQLLRHEGGAVERGHGDRQHQYRCAARFGNISASKPMQTKEAPAIKAAAHDGRPAAPALSIVIVNWNGGDVLRRCLDSIAQFPPRVPFEVVVVDNGSSDGSVQLVRAAARDWVRAGAALRLIENRENVGFSRANNQAIAGSQAGLLLLLNADT